MAKNKNLNNAARDKNDEFYTQYDDIQREMNCYCCYYDGQTVADDINYINGKLAYRRLLIRRRRQDDSQI